MHRLSFFSAFPLDLRYSIHLAVLKPVREILRNNYLKSNVGIERRIPCLKLLDLPFDFGTIALPLSRRISILPLVYVTYLGIPTPPWSAPAIPLADPNGAVLGFPTQPSLLSIPLSRRLSMRISGPTI